MKNKANNIFQHIDCLSEETLLNYLSGKLSSAEKHEAEKHLIDCEMCSDAIEGLKMIPDNKKISDITSALLQKTQQRIEKREIKIFSIKPYRIHLAAAAAILFIVGLIFFFRNNIITKQLDSSSSKKIFAEKFEPYLSGKKEEMAAGKEQAEAGNSHAKIAVPSPSAKSGRLSGEQDKKTASADDGVKEGKDVSDEEKFGLTTNTPLQKSEQAQPDITAEEKSLPPASHYKNPETAPKQNVTDASGIKYRDEDVSLMNKEVSGVPSLPQNDRLREKNENRAEGLSEKSPEKKGATKKDENNKSETPPAIISETQTNMGEGKMNPTDKKATLKQENKKITDNRKQSEETAVMRKTKNEGDVPAGGSGKKTRSKSSDKAKKVTPDKQSGGYYETQTAVGSASPKAQSQGIQTETFAADSVSSFFSAIETKTTATDYAMAKYDKQDYAGAVTEFENLLSQNPNDETALFYSGVSYLSLGQADNAITNLNKVLQNKNEKYHDDAQWYLSLAYIKKKDVQNARRNLTELSNNSKSKYQKQASETLKEIEK